MQTRKQKEKSKSLGQEGAGTSLGGQSLVLLCTDVAARGLNLPAVDWIVQFDPPSETREYVHRVGRTARSGGRGQALLFLLHSELGYLQHLEQQGLHLKQHGDPSPRVKIAVFLQQQVRQALSAISTTPYPVRVMVQVWFGSFVTYPSSWYGRL